MRKSTKLTLAEFRERINQIKACKGDPEATHVYEDDLIWEMLEGVEEGLYTKKMLAEFVRMLREVNHFPKWYA